MAKDWKITSAKLDTDIASNGTGFNRVWQVNYEVTDGPASGTVGHVRIPVTQYNAETVQAAVSQAVSHHQKVMSL